MREAYALYRPEEDAFLANKKVHFVVNPVAGNGLSVKNRLEIENVAKLYDRNNAVTLEETLEPGHATDIAKNSVERGIQVLVVVGGDGTLQEVVEGSKFSEVTVANIPTGFLNIWARGMRIPTDIKRAGQRFLDGKVKRVDLGEVNGRTFLQFANFGFDSEEYMKVHKPGTIRKRGGMATFAEVFARCMVDGLNYDGHSVHVTLNGEEFNTNLLIGVDGNSTDYGGLKLRNDVDISDGQFETSFFVGRNAFDFLPEFIRLLLKKEPGKGLILGKLKENLTIECAPNDKIGVTIDGNPLDYFDTLHARVLPLAQSVMVPR